MYWLLFIYPSKYIFSQITIVKTSQKRLALSKTVRNGSSSGSVLMFLQITAQFQYLNATKYPQSGMSH